MGFKMLLFFTVGVRVFREGGGGGVLHPNAAAAEAAPRVYKLAFRVGSAALGAA